MKVPPWEIGRPQPALVTLAESGSFSGRVLETGCGSGENALLIAALGQEVVGVDVDAAALAAAGRKAEERGLGETATFRRFDVLDLAGFGETFDTILDSLLFHALGGAAREAYVAGLRTVLRPGGRLYVLCYSDAHDTAPIPPHTVSLADVRTAFADGWTIGDVQATTAASNLHPDGVAAWLITCTRV